MMASVQAVNVMWSNNVLVKWPWWWMFDGREFGALMSGF
jgi:hypothetical protein